MIGIRGALLLAAGLAASAAAEPPPQRSAERELLTLVNRERTRRSLPALRWHAVLARLARSHAADMRRMGKTTHHSSADGADFTRRLARSEMRASAAAENVAFAPDVARAHRGLMDSPGHRRNILDPALTAVGIAILNGEGGIHVVQDFAAPIEDLSNEQAADRVRDAVRRARTRAGRPALEERRSLSERLTSHLERLIRADSVAVDAGLVPGPAWVVAYTTPSPSAIADDALARIGRADGYALAAGFGRTPSYPFGTYWVILALTGDI